MKTNKVLSHGELKALALNNPEVQKEYIKTQPEFDFLLSLIKARKRANLSQQQVAIRMGTQQAAVARIETKLSEGKFPSVMTLQRYVNAIGKTLVFSLR